MRWKPPARWDHFGGYTLKRLSADKVTVHGGQTERRGEAGPLRYALGGRTSPADCLKRSASTSRGPHAGVASGQRIGPFGKHGPFGKRLLGMSGPVG